MRKHVTLIMLVIVFCFMGMLVACSGSQSPQAAGASASGQSASASSLSQSANSAISNKSEEASASSEAESQSSTSQLASPSIENASVGNHVGFGKYRQSDDANAVPEQIEWRVLSCEGDRALLISEYGLDSHPFDSKSGIWEDSDLRDWLNTTFVNSAFSSSELERIDGEVFCLSADEAESLFASNEERLCVPTKYAIKQDIEPDKTGKCSWWLRTHGTDGNPVDGDVAAIVATPGTVFIDGQFVDSKYTAVRPAIWVNL